MLDKVLLWPSVGEEGPMVGPYWGCLHAIWRLERILPPQFRIHSSLWM